MVSVCAQDEIINLETEMWNAIIKYLSAYISNNNWRGEAYKIEIRI